MAPRANWKGYLNRVHYQMVDADTGEEVPQEDRVKGYQVDRDSYVLLDALRVQSERRGSSPDTRRSKARKRAAPRGSALKRKKLKRAS